MSGSSHLKYLDELILAIKSSKINPGYSQSSTGSASYSDFPPPIPNDGDPKGLKVLKTLIKNLHDPNLLPEIFSKAIEALDLLIQSKPYLLQIIIDNSTTCGIEWLVERFKDIAVINWDKITYLWLLRRKLASWCALTVNMYGLRWELTLSNQILSLLAKHEETITLMLRGSCEINTLLVSMKSILVLCGWCCSQEFRKVLLLLDNTTDTNKWDCYFQRLTRIVLYVFDSIDTTTLEKFDEISRLETRFITLLTQHLITQNTRFHIDNRELISTTELKFTLGMLHSYVTKNIGVASWRPIDTSVLKCILRVYSLCLRDNGMLKLFVDNFVITQWFTDSTEVKEIFPFDETTNKCLGLIYYDTKRRSVSKDQLFFDKSLLAWDLKSDEYPLIKQCAYQPFDRSRQLENLRKLILSSFRREEQDTPSLKKHLSNLCISFEDGWDPALRKIDSLIKNSFKQGNIYKCVQLVMILGRLTCLETHKNFKTIPFCPTCDAVVSKTPLGLIDPNRPEAHTKSKIFQILVRYYIQNDSINEFSESLIAGILITLQRIFTHFQPPELIIENGAIQDQTLSFRLVKCAYTSTSRYLRVLSIKLLPVWNISALHNSEDAQTAIFIQFLQENSARFLTETSLMAWVHLTLSTSGESFDSLLLKLIDIFNSTDYAEHNIMAFQLRHVATLTKKTPYQLLSPVLPILLKQICKNLVEKKLAFQRLVDLVEYPPKTLLENFQRYIVPHAITQYKSDIISEIARIMCDNDSSLVMEQKERLLDKNSRQIFAVALVKHGFFALETLETLFLNRVPSFDKSYISAFLPDYKTLAEVLKLYNNSDETNESSKENANMILCSLRFLMTNFERDKRHGSKYKNISDWTETQESLFQKKLQDNILGIFQVFSSDMHDAEGRTTYYEKLRVINGISFLILHASKECIISALAQVSICLQTGLEIPEVQLNTLKCWHSLVHCLTEEELLTVVDGLLAFILQKWDALNLKSQSMIYEILGTLIENKSNLVLKLRPYITLALVNKNSLHILERHASFARSVTRVLNSNNWILIFANNLKSNNKYVVRQNLNDIMVYLERKQEGNLDFASKHGSITDISLLLGALLDTSHKFRTTDLEICQKSANCISMVGVLDVTRHELKRGATHLNTVCNFNDQNQTIKFLINIINDRLVPAFWQSENPTKQLFVALVMQESLKYCGLSSMSWDIKRPDIYPNEAKLWNRFNDISRTTLYPLLSSLYLAQSWKEYVPLQYPSYNVKEGYHAWIRNLTLDLLKTGTEEGHPLHVFSSLIREDDGSLSDYLLPNVIMDIIIKADSGTPYVDILDNVRTEFEYIFNYELYQLNHFQIDSLKMCYESIFKVLEYCKKWVIQFKQDYNKIHGTFTIREEKNLKMLERADNFLNNIPSGLMAQRSVETDSFERSALYLEQCYRNKDMSGIGEENLFPYLKTTYAEIGDIDSVDGVLKTFSTDSLTSKIEELQYSDNWKMAQDCFEALGDTSDHTPFDSDERQAATTKMLKSMYGHQLYDQTLVKLNLLVPKKLCLLNDNVDEWYNMGIEAATLTGHIDQLREWVNRVETLEKVSDPSIILHYNVAKVFLSIHENNEPSATKFIENCYRLIGTHFTTPSTSTTLLKKREVLMQLHALHDISILLKGGSPYQHNNNIKILNSRLQKIGADFEPNHYLLSMRKAYGLLKQEDFVKPDLANTFFKIAQLSRVNSRLDLASDSLMHALKFRHQSGELEYAEILWKQGENDKALKMVAEIHEKHKNDTSIRTRERAKVLLKYTEWLDLSNNSVSEQIMKQYNELIKLDPRWDEPYYSMGVYCSRLLEKKKAEGYVTNGRLECKSVSFFLMSFEKSTAKVREALPKVVTFWLDIAALYISENTPSNRRELLKKPIDDICKRIETAVHNCPTYIWYSVLTQLLSRLLHSHTPSAQLIMHILLNLAMEYPCHMLWYISVLLNSNNPARVSSGRQIMERYKQHSTNSKDLVMSSSDLVYCLTCVCIKDIKNSASRSGRSLEKDFKFNMNIAPSRMVVPINVNLEMVSPASSESMKKFDPFRPIISIAKFGSSYKIFSSLKKPKKLNIVGSDGKIYGIMCKKEDVRQDNQYMQFATTMDFLLSKDLDSTKRSLGITTYSVLSLREDCGLLEIVPNVTTLRSILVTKYDSMKIKYNLKSLHDKWQHIPQDQKLQFFKELSSKFPPVLYEWFLENFPDPIAWYNSRNAFARSYAVMAMVGHILGLGDRHCENILLDIETGKVLHVDFDCLFEKGKLLPIPEIVPFRLTKNLTDALGITGTEGTFKKSSEVTLKLMRTNEIALVNIIETIMYDRNMDHSIQKALKVLRNKIRGIDPRDGLALSVPGQVETVVQESTSEENLSQMYIGWLPFW